MLERVALQQTRFRTPGLIVDGRGVAYGEKLALLFPSLDRLVAFLRGYGERESLDELLGSLRIAQVRTPLKAVEIIVTLATDSTDRADRVASYAKLAGGLTFTGSATHFVRYRDASAPLGYDLRSLSTQSGDFLLYDDTFEQSYTTQREIPFRELVLRLSVQPAPETAASLPSRVLLTAEAGVAQAVLRYLFRWQVRGTVALGEWPAASAFDDGPRRLHIFVLDEVPPRILALFRSMAGVAVFRLVSRNVAVELGHAHPISLDACERLFAENALVLFRAKSRAELLEPLPPSVPIESLVSAALDVSAEPVVKVRPEARVPGITLPVRLRPTLDAPRNVVATVIDAREHAWLSALLYRLPEVALSKLRVARTESHFFVLCDQGIEALPLGVFHCAVLERVYVPIGFTLEPALSAQTLRTLLGSQGNGHVFVTADGVTRVDDAAFVPLLENALVALEPITLTTTPMVTTEDTLPMLTYGDVSRGELRDFDEESEKGS